METVILIFHLIIVVTMVLVILIQRNSNDGLSGLGGGSSNPGGMMARGSSNPLSKATSILATLFICTSLGLAYLANAKNESVIVDDGVPEIKETNQVPFQLDEDEIKKALRDGVGSAPVAETSKEDDKGDAAPVGSVVPEAKKIEGASDSVKAAAEEKTGVKAEEKAPTVPLAQ